MMNFVPQVNCGVQVNFWVGLINVYIGYKQDTAPTDILSGFTKHPYAKASFLA